METTLVLLKPDCIQRRLTGRILTRFEEKGLRISAMKFLRIDVELARRHYVEHLEKDFYPSLERFITSGPVVVVAMTGPEAIRVVRALVGSTNGLDAAAGTIRGDFSVHGTKNLVHASDGPDSAARELAIFFRPEELLEYETPSSEWIL